MNGWEKIIAALSAVAGIVYIIGFALGLSDGLSLTEDCLENFAAIDNFAYMAVLAGLIAAIAGYAIICNGSSKKDSTTSALGIMFVFLGMFVTISAIKNDVTNLSWEYIEVVLAGLFVGTAAMSALVCAKAKNYIAADVSILLAFVLVIMFAFDMKMLIFVVGMVVLIIIGLLQATIKPVADEAEEAVAAPAEANIVLEPAKPATPAKPPVVREKPAEEAAPAKAKAAPAAAAKEAAKPAAKEEAKPAEAAPAKAEAKPAESAPAPKSEEKAAAAATAAAATAAAAAAEKKEPAKEESELDKLLAQGWKVTVDAVGEDKANEMDDGEIMYVVSEKDPELYQKLSAATGVVATAPAKEESELDKLLAQGWKVTVDAVGEDKANEMDDGEIMEVISIADPELYQKLSALTGIVVAASAANIEESVVEEAEDAGYEFSDEDLGLIPDTPSGFVRRACWNKGLRCRKDYGPYVIPFAFVKSKVAVYIDAGKADHTNDEALISKKWVVFHFQESEITDGLEQAELINNAVKENTRALKKAKPKAKKKR